MIENSYLINFLDENDTHGNNDYRREWAYRQLFMMYGYVCEEYFVGLCYEPLYLFNK